MPRLQHSETGKWTSDTPPEDRRAAKLAYLRKWQAAQIAKGLCRCGKPVTPGSKYSCPACRVERQAYREQRFQKGWCTWCDKRPHLVDARLCRECADRGAEKAARRRYLCKRACMTHFGGQCACCGETKLAFLTLDHVNTDGKAHRLEMGFTGQAFYQRLVRDKFVSAYALQVLCWNCNLGRRINGGACPHQDQ